MWLAGKKMRGKLAVAVAQTWLVWCICILPATSQYAGAGGNAATDITTVYLVSSCHLDVGFADTASNIVNRYFDDYFPAAIAVARELSEAGLPETLVFTTHPFLVWLYLNCYEQLGLHCPGEQALEDFMVAVKSGHITWHAFPFNSEMEYYDQSLAEFGFQVTHRLDKLFGRNATITMSQRDVPGITRSVIPLMVANGVQAITVGVNTVSMPPAVPSVFRWQDPLSQTEVVAMWHPHGYGGQNGPSMDSVVMVPGMPVALAFAIRGDNSGPPSAPEVLENYDKLRELFPGAKIVASGYDTFVSELIRYSSLLPVYAGEIGDTWIQGVASDPWKTALAREMMRLRSDCLDSGACSMEDERFVAFSMMLLKSGEHTWGKDVKTFLHDTENWYNYEFHRVQYTSPNFIDVASSWLEQRFWGNSFPVDLLGNHSLRADIVAAAAALWFNGTIDTTGYTLLNSVSDGVICGAIEVQFSEKHGGIVRLIDTRQPWNPVSYASDTNPLAKVLYQTFISENYETFFDEYFYDFGPKFSREDFGKPGWTGEANGSAGIVPLKLWVRNDGYSCSLLLKSEFFEEAWVVNEFGGSAEVWTQLVVPWANSPKESVSLNLTLYFTNKTATRIPESLSLYFNPAVSNPSEMVISKLGEYISVLDVMKNGSKHLHGSDKGIMYPNGPSFYARHSSLVCIGEPTPFPTPMEQPDVKQGFAFNLVNNIWGTNYIMWYPYQEVDASFKFDFQIVLPVLPTD